MAVAGTCPCCRASRPFVGRRKHCSPGRSVVVRVVVELRRWLWWLSGIVVFMVNGGGIMVIAFQLLALALYKFDNYYY